MATLTGRITCREFRQMQFPDDDTAYCELIDGELVKKSAPTPKHQIISGNLYAALRAFVSGRQLGIVLYAPVDVFLDDYNLVQPDVLFLFAATLDRITDDGIMGAPDLIAEIIWASSAVRDRHSKLKPYEQCGVNEYWLIDAQNSSVEVYRRAERGCELFSAASVQGVASSVLLSGFSLALETLFAA